MCVTVRCTAINYLLNAERLLAKRRGRPGLAPAWAAGVRPFEARAGRDPCASSWPLLARVPACVRKRRMVCARGCCALCGAGRCVDSISVS
jgi:hypothetical protein